MGARQSTTPSQGMSSTAAAPPGHRTYMTPAGSTSGHGAGSSGNGADGASTSARHLNSRHRAVSLGHGGGNARHRGFPLTLPHGVLLAEGASIAAGAVGGGSPDSDDSTPEDGEPLQARGPFLTSSLPVHLFAFRDIKCPVCSKSVPPDDVECHLVMCLTRPRITYNEDVLSEDKDECVTCLEVLHQGDSIARLPCLCIYHKAASISGSESTDRVQNIQLINTTVAPPGDHRSNYVVVRRTQIVHTARLPKNIVNDKQPTSLTLAFKNAYIRAIEHQRNLTYLSGKQNFRALFVQDRKMKCRKVKS